MAVTAARFTVSTSAVALNTADTTSVLRMLVTNTSANPARLGASNVVAGTGYLLAAGASISVELDPGDVLFAIRDGGTDAAISVVRT